MLTSPSGFSSRLQETRAEMRCVTYTAPPVRVRPSLSPVHDGTEEDKVHNSWVKSQGLKWVILVELLPEQEP